MLCTKNYINSACHHKNNFGDDIDRKKSFECRIRQVLNIDFIELI